MIRENVHWRRQPQDYDETVLPEQPTVRGQKLLDELISEVRTDVKQVRGDKRVPKEGVDLSPFRDELWELLRQSHQIFQTEKDDYETRYGQHVSKDPRKADGNDPDERRFDYGKDAGAGFEGWEEDWERSYKRPAGKPPENQLRKGALPAHVFRPVYELIRDWWNARSKELRPFSPRFIRDPSQLESADYNFEYSNGPARLVFLIGIWLHRDYNINNFANLPRTIRDHRKKHTAPIKPKK